MKRMMIASLAALAVVATPALGVTKTSATMTKSAKADAKAQAKASKAAQKAAAKSAKLAAKNSKKSG